MAPPSVLEQVSEASAIDRLHRVGDVGTTNEPLLRRLLPHCTAEDLELIETETDKNGRDLSSITDELWRKHYGRRFGVDHANDVQERLAKGGRTYKWRRLFKAKMWEQEKLQTEGVDRLKELFQQQNAKKDSRKIQAIDKIPPESRKRAKTTTTVPVPAGPGRSSSKKPASVKVLPPEAGMTNKAKTSKEVEAEKKLAKKGGPERGRLWRKSVKDFNKMKLLLSPVPPPWNRANNIKKNSEASRDMD